MKTMTFLFLSILFSLNLYAQTSADSVTVTFRVYEASSSLMFLPGEFNAWGNNSSGNINVSDPSHMTIYNSSMGCWLKTYSFKTIDPSDSRRTLGDSIFQYKINKGGTSTGWYKDPINQEVNSSDNGNSVIRLRKLFWFEYNQVIDGAGINITRVSMSLVHANSDRITSVTYTYGNTANSSLTTLNIFSAYDSVNGFVDYTLASPIPKLDYVRLVAYNNHGDSAVYAKGGYVWSTIVMPSYVINGVTLPSVASNDSTSFRLRVSNKNYVLVRVAPVGQPVATAPAIVMNHNTDNENWWVNVNLAPGTYEYVYELDDGTQIYDPWGRQIGTNGTRFTVGSAGLTADDYVWHSTSYQRPPMKKLEIYEMNLDEFVGGYYGLAAGQEKFSQLSTLVPYLDSLGINAIELMPVTDFGLIGPSGFSWGYDVNSWLALEPAFGTPGDFKAFIDTAHSHGIAVIMDMVFNQLNTTSALWTMQPDVNLSPYFKLCSDIKYNEDNLCFFEDADHWTSQTQELVYTSLKMWIDQYHIDGFRYDYTQGIGWNVNDTTYGVLGWANKIARDYNNTVYQISEHLPESPALIYYSGLNGSWHGAFREKLFNETDNQNTSLSDFENYVLGLGGDGTNDTPADPSTYSGRTEPVNDCSNHDEQSLLFEMVHYKGIPLTTALQRDKLYATFMFTSLGMPMLWEGIEFGAPRGYDGTNKLNYRPVEWGNYHTANGQSQYNYYHTLIMQRKYNPALYNGTMVTQWHYDSQRVIVWGFHDDSSGAQVEVISNLSGSQQTVTNVPWLASGNWYDVFDQTTFNAPSTSLASFTIPAYTARVFSNKRNGDLGIPLGVQGLVAYYPFNGDASDVSGNINNGTVNGAALTTDRFTNTSQAYHFNGSSDYIQVPQSSSLKFGTHITLNLWVNIDTGGTGHPRLISMGSTPDGFEFHLDNAGSSAKRIAFDGKIGGTSGLFGGYSKSLLSNQSWYMLTYTQDSLTGKLYINGMLDTTFTNANGTLPSPAVDLFMGKNSQSSSDYFNGTLDDISLYNVTLSAAGVDSLFHIGGWGYGSISGTKYNDLAGDSSITGDPGLSGWTIKLYQNCSLVARKVTDGSGNYSFTNLDAGSYTVEESLKTGWIQTYPRVGSPNVLTTTCGLNDGSRSYSLSVALSQNITGINFGNGQQGHICGIVFRDDNGNGVKNGAEPGLQNWTVMLSGTLSETTQTDAQGHYCFNGIQPGNYTISEGAQPGWVRTTADYGTIALASGGALDTINIGNFLFGSISGLAYDDMNGNGIMEAGDTLLLGWNIYLDKIGQASPYKTRVTGVDGTFSFDSLTSGRYLLYEEHRTGWSQSSSRFDTVTITSGQTLSNQNFGNVTGYLGICNVLDRWNLISIPVHLLDRSTTTNFPTAFSSAFAFAGGYVESESLETGKGYWLKFSGAQQIRLIGNGNAEDSIPVTQGWNLIGSINVPVPVSSIGSNPGGIVTSEFYGFNLGYVTTDSIFPGKGYWVKTDQAGELILSTNALISAENRIKIHPSSDLPPLPPNGQATGDLIPKEYALEQNFPNPFNPSTVINYQLPHDNFVTLKIFNVLGQEVSTLVNGYQDAGYKAVQWNAAGLPSGIYFYRIQAGSFTDIKKMILIQ